MPPCRGRRSRAQSPRPPADLWPHRPSRRICPPQPFDPGGVEGDDEVLVSGQLIEGPHHLEGPGDPELGDPVGHLGADLPALEDHLSGIRLHEPRDQVDQGGLARAVGADDPEELALSEVEAQPPRRPPPRRSACSNPRPSGSSPLPSVYFHQPLELMVLALKVVEDPLGKSHHAEDQDGRIEDHPQGAEGPKDL